MVATALNSLKTCLHFYSQFALLNQARLNLRDPKQSRNIDPALSCMQAVKFSTSLVEAFHRPY